MSFVFVDVFIPAKDTNVYDDDDDDDDDGDRAVKRQGIKLMEFCIEKES